MTAVEWDDDAAANAAAGSAPAAGEGGEGGAPPPGLGDDEASLTGDIESGSILDGIVGEAEDVLEDDTKTLQVGKHRRLWARYRATTDDERAELRVEAQNEHVARERATGRGQGRKRKAGAQKLHDAKAQDATERYFDALVLATACEEILLEVTAEEAAQLAAQGITVTEDEVERAPRVGDHVPLQDVMGTAAPVTYNRTLAKWMCLDRLVGLNVDNCSPEQVVTALHTFGRARSTAPLSTQAEVYKMWNAAVTAQALEEAMGGI